MTVTEGKNISVLDKYTKEDIMVPAADGVLLRTIIFKPKDGKETWPCVVERCPYAGMLMKIADDFASAFCARGYVYVLQMCRGVAGSQGKWEPNINERDDGLSLLHWLERQDWVENIGYKGYSYLALAGWAMADAVPEKVKSMFLSAYGCDRFTSAYSNGLFRHDVLTGWSMQNAGFPVEADYLESCRHLPLIEVDEAMWGGRVDWYRDYISNPDNRNGYWSDGFWGMLSDIPRKVKLPLYIVEGWFDHHLASALKSYERLPQGTKDKTILEIGPWDHSLNMAVHGYEKSIKNADADQTNKMLDWFDLTLKRGEIPEGRVNYYHVGSDTWKNAAVYPFTDNGGVTYGLSRTVDGKHLLYAAKGEGIVSFIYDPKDPVPSVGAESMLTTEKQRGSLVQPEPDYRPDVITFLSPVLEEALDVTGKVKIKLRVASDAEDTAFCAKLCEVMPDGKAYNLRTMIGSLAYREGLEQPVDYTPGTFVDLELNSWDISWHFQKGSRIRLDVTSSDFPQYAAHPNSKALWSTVKEVRIAHQQIDCTASSIYFPAGE